MSAESTQFEADCRSRGIDVDIALAVRKAVARVLKIDESSLRFDTPTDEVIRLAACARIDGWDDLAFVFVFEEVAGVSLPDDLRFPRMVPGRFFFWKRPGAAIFGEWCQNVVPVLKDALAKKQEARNV